MLETDHSGPATHSFSAAICVVFLSLLGGTCWHVGCSGLPDWTSLLTLQAFLLFHHLNTWSPPRSSTKGLCSHERGNRRFTGIGSTSTNRAHLAFLVLHNPPDRPLFQRTLATPAGSVCVGLHPTTYICTPGIRSEEELDSVELQIYCLQWTFLTSLPTLSPRAPDASKRPVRARTRTAST